MACKTLQGKYAEKLEKENNNMNEKINELYNKLDAQDEIIEQQIEIINKQKKQIDKAIEYIKQYNLEGVKLNSDYWYDCLIELLKILGDKENVYECQCCDKEFEKTEIINNQKVCPYCYSGDIIGGEEE